MTRADARALPDSTIDSRSSPDPLHERVVSEFRAFVQQPDFPCLGAKSVVRVNSYELEVYGALGNRNDARVLVSDLANFSENAIENRLSAFVAVFPDSPPEDEIEFERRLWRQLQFLHDVDQHHARRASDVSSDPDDSHFSFSVGGRAFFVVGLNPRSSRVARRFHWPTLVFNPHEQFSRLRAQGRFDGPRSAIRARDIALQGTENPNLADFGERSEARQYSGRQTERDWKCPFHPKVP
ncbi:MAG: YqcI/YcgG family protein [Gemmatimonadota bacterium]|nr:YqcI/YcgG family protein [Gemmatimonadota bacterium]